MFFNFEYSKQFSSTLTVLLVFKRKEIIQCMAKKKKVERTCTYMWCIYEYILHIQNYIDKKVEP